MKRCFAFPISALLAFSTTACVERERASHDEPIEAGLGRPAADPSADSTGGPQAKSKARKEVPAPKQQGSDGFTGDPLSSKKTKTGLVLEDFLVGEGAEAVKGSNVRVHYTGMLDDGTVFDSSYKKHRPLSFTCGANRVIKGWDEGVVGMRVGGKRRLVVPPELGYGNKKAGRIPPGSRLTFHIELVDVTAPLPDAQGDEAFEGKPLSKSEREGGLIIEDFAPGEGDGAQKGDSIMVHYTGKLDDGTVFDSSVPRKRAIGFVLGTGRVIKGWDMGIEGMKVGGLRRLTVPAALGYKDRDKGKIPANSRLTFTVELMAIRSRAAKRSH